jgi:hypothetical protein
MTIRGFLYSGRGASLVLEAGAPAFCSVAIGFSATRWPILLWVIFDQSSRSFLPVDVCFAPKAD